MKCFVWRNHFGIWCCTPRRGQLGKAAAVVWQWVALNRDAIFPDFSGIPDFLKTDDLNQNWKVSTSYCCFNIEEVVPALSLQFTMWCHLVLS